MRMKVFIMESYVIEYQWWYRLVNTIIVRVYEEVREWSCDQESNA